MAKKFDIADLVLFALIFSIISLIFGGYLGNISYKDKLEHDRQLSYSIYLEAKENALKDFEKAKAIYLEEHNEETN